MLKPDLFILRQGRPVAIVEAKARPVSAAFREPVLRQLQAFATSASTPWSILVDPQTTAIFRHDDLSRPWVSLSTGEMLEAAELPRPRVLGERGLLNAVDRWVHELPRRRDFIARHPKLADFVKDVSDGITSTEDWPG